MLKENIGRRLNNAEVIESTQDNSEEIYQEVVRLFSYAKRKAEIHIVLDEIKHKAFICLYKEPLLKISKEVISLERDSNNNWIPC